MASGENVMRKSRAMEPEENLCGDRFSNLPDALAYCILSFVNVDDFDPLMLVSKRWNRLCLSAPCLSMVNSSFSHDSTNRADLDSFLDQYFSRRGESGAKVQQLRIVWSFLQAKPLVPSYGRGKRKRNQQQEKECCNEDDSVFSCLTHCVRLCNPEHVEVNLVLRDGGCHGGRLSAFLVGRVRDLVLTMNNTGFTLPVSTIRSNLEKLTLKSVRVSSKSVVDHFTTHQFPKLKLLRLYDCTGIEDLRIYNRSLEHLEIINEKPTDLCFLTLGCMELRTLYITWYPQSLNGAHLDTCAPKIEHFELKGFPLRYCHFSRCKHIKSAAIYCTCPSGRSLDQCCGLYLSKVVRGVMMAKSLRFLANTIEILFKQSCKRFHLSSLEGVETLHIDDCYLTDDEVPAIAFLLKMMPDLKNIYLSSSKVKPCIPLEVSGFKVDYWEAQDLKFVQQLETATVEIPKEQGNAAELIKYFAKHGERLENLKVICHSAMVSAVSDQIELVKSNVVNVTYVQCTKA